MNLTLNNFGNYSSSVKKKRERVGRGEGSKGKTCGRGQKGQKSRAGASIPAWFEGGQMPLVRRIPKRGFKNINKKIYFPLNVSSLNVFNDGQSVDISDFKNSKLIPKNCKMVVILGNGEITKKLTVSAERFSESAKNKILEAGGNITEIIK